MSDYTGAKLLYPHLPGAQTLIADKGYDSDEFRNALIAKGITPCIPARLNRTAHTNYDKEIYRTRGRIEMMFGRLKDWRRIAMRYDRAAHTFFSAICIAATVIFWTETPLRHPLNVKSEEKRRPWPRAERLQCECQLVAGDRVGHRHRKIAGCRRDSDPIIEARPHRHLLTDEWPGREALTLADLSCHEHNRPRPVCCTDLMRPRL